MKSELRRCDLAARSPITPSARPYIGEESISFPPCFTKSDSTSPSGFSWDEPGPTSNVVALPSPITGSFSPDDGIERKILEDSLAAQMGDVPIRSKTPAAVPPINRVTSRRVIIFVIPTEVEESLAVNQK